MIQANCDDEPAMKAILAGLKKRHDTTGDTPILIHTVCTQIPCPSIRPYPTNHVLLFPLSPALQSGGAVLADNARGEYASDTVTSDLDLAALDALPPSAPHHAVDLLAISASTAGYARTYLVFPAAVYGKPAGALFDAGIAHKHSFVIPWLTKVFAKRGRAGLLGTGANIWPNVHIDDGES